MQQALNLSDEKRDLPFVPYDMPATTKGWHGLALIGEAPGAEEARLGHPFVGRSGQLLGKMLEQGNIQRPDCLVANAFRLQPPGNKVAHFFTSRRAATQQGTKIAEEWGQFSGAWVRGEFAADLDHLAGVLQKLKPAAILALGRTALWALTGQNGLLDKIGKPIEGRMCPGVPVIPTYHPSFIMRGNWGLQEHWGDHFATAKRYIK